jgi:hypothetical protein
MNVFNDAIVNHDEMVGRIELSIGSDGASYHVEYNAPPAIDVVVHPEILAKYSACFTHYLRIIRLERLLSKSWMSIVGLFRKQFNGLVYLQGVDELTRQMNYLRSRLWKWVHAFRFVVCFEVVQPAWTALINQIEIRDTCNDLDSLIIAHEEYMKSIYEGMFIRSDHLVNVLDALDRFIKCEMAIHTELESSMQNDLDVSPFRFKNIHELLVDIDDSFTVAADEFDVHLQALAQISSDIHKQEFYDRVRSHLTATYYDQES